MPNSGRRLAATAAGMLAALAAASASPGVAGDAASVVPTVRGPLAVETVFFGRGKGAPVRVLRGSAKAAHASLPAVPLLAGGQQVQIVSFGNGFADQVKVVRGIATAALTTMAARPERHIERVSFADPRLPAVTIVRGLGPRLATFTADLFGPASGGEFDRIAFAVDGVESRHGADMRMWRPELDGPQGPMQVTAAAALDVGGGDRFDLRQNRLLGRAYLAQMFRRYGNWRDALAAYNWGPGNLDLWIAGGRDGGRLPPGVAYYVARVLRDALITTAAGL